MLPQRGVLMLCNPAHLHVHKRIVCDVYGIGYVTQPLAYGCAFGIGSGGAGTSQYNQWEQDKYAQSLEKTIGNALFTANTRRGEN